jgi:hypothetical protein
MQLVLAIHADRRQTELIAALLRKRAAIEIVQASDAGEGLQELGDRVPDLILTSPLLSPFDEDVLAEYLRELGSAGAHLQTLRIPVLTMPESSGGGFFSLRKKKRVEAGTDGCDPSYFVEEITQYLARAAEDRKTKAPASWTAPVVEPTPTNVARETAFEPYPMARHAESSRADTHRYPGSDTSESAFPIYRPEPVTQHEDEPASSYSFDAPGEEPTASTYHVDRTQGPEDITPIYQPLDYAPDTPVDVTADAPSVEWPASDYLRASEPATPIYQPPPLPKPMRSERVMPLAEQATESTPIYEPRRVPQAPVYAPPVEAVVHVFEPPPQVSSAAPAETSDGALEPSANAHASLVLDPPQPEPVAADPPFVVHSTEERIPLSESLERAAAELEASSVGEPMPSRETERVPLHQLSSIEEIPLPEVLAARVERTAALHRSAAPESRVSRNPSPSRPSTSAPIASPSLLASPIEIEAPAKPLRIDEPKPAEVRSRPVADVPTEAPPLTQHSTAQAPEPEKPSSPKRTPSFEAALAAIRKAWGRPRRASNSPLTLNLNRTIEEPEPSPVVAAPSSPPPAESAKALVIDDAASREVDLTLDIEALDDHGSVTVVEPTVPEQVGIVAQQADEDVYELSASPALHDLEADLAAAGPPPPVREVFPASLIEPSEEATPEEPTEVETADASAAPAPRKRDKHRKKSDKRQPLKAQKPAATAAAPPAAPPAAPRPPQPQEPAQDEWGLFDPNQCGFAALVDKLNEVTDEKDQKPTKTTVRVISYG